MIYCSYVIEHFERGNMRNKISILIVCLLTGCAGSPPKPPEFKGEYKPINKPAFQGSFSVSKIFNFEYEGDIVDALNELKKVQPQLNVMPPLGKRLPLLVRVNLKDATLEDVLKSLGEQGGTVADVIYNKSQQQGGNQVFIRFNKV